MVQPVPEYPEAQLADPNPPEMHLSGSKRTKMVTTLLVSSTVLFATYLAAGSVLLPAQVQNLYPNDKETKLAIVTSISSFATLFVQPIVGALSDRTRSRFGRRAPWMIGGAVLGGIMICLIPILGVNVGFIALCWVLAQVSLNGYQGPLTATISDRLDPSYRGTASAFLGVGTTVGMTLGIVVAGLLVTQLGLGYAIFGIAVIVFAFLFVLLNPDKSSKDLHVEPFHLGTFLKGFWISPKQHPDFGWAFAQRFVMFLGTMGIVGYMFYILTSYLELSQAEAGVFMGLQSMIYAASSVVATFIAGPLSDRLQRRKIFVFIASLLIAVGVAMPLLFPSKLGIILYAIIAGAGFGSYMAVDVALVVDILPNPEDAAKDLGIINIANNVPQMLAPIVNAILVRMTGGYSALFIWSMIIVVLASFLVMPIKKVR